MRSTPPLSEVREALEGLRDAVLGRGGAPGEPGAGRELRAEILTALVGEPRNGHQIMQAIGAAPGSAGVPAAGQVYPLLQQLTDEGLLSARLDDERTVYTLTEAGREAAAARRSAPGAARAGCTTHGRWSEPSTALPRAGAKLAQAAALVASTGTREQQERAAALLDETRRSLSAILAESADSAES